MVQTNSGRPTVTVVLQRIGFGSLAIIVLVSVFWADAWIARRAAPTPGPLGALLRQGSVLPVLFVVMLTAGAIELWRMLGAVQIRPCVSIALVMIIAQVVTPWLAAAGLLSTTVDEVFRWQVIWILLAIVGSAIALIVRRRPDGAFCDIGGTLIMVVYLGFLGSFGLQIRCSTFLTAQDGAWLLLAIVLITKAADIGGFFVGSAIGRHKLIPAVSPGKSVEGTVGALVASGLAAVLVASGPAVVDLFSTGADLKIVCTRVAAIVGLAETAESAGSLANAFFFGAVIGLAGQCGDLIESCFKRDAGSKDSGRIVPRFGGILDLIDSPLLALPVAWLLLAVVWEMV